MSRIQPSATLVWSAASAPPCIRTLPESSTVAAKLRRVGGRDDEDTESVVQERLSGWVVSRTHIVLKGIKAF